MDDFSVEFKGLAELEAKLEAMSTEQATRAVNRGLAAGGEVFREAVAEAAPIRPDLPSGTALPPGALKSDIVKRRTRDADGAPVEVVGPGKYTRHAAVWVEYGHRLVRGGYSRMTKNGGFRGPGKEIGKVPAHPFIRPAFEASAEKATAAAIDTIVEEVEKNASK
jgi:HK97 gp10 family phage protein